MKTLDKTEREIVDQIIKYSQSEEGLENNVIYFLEQISSNGSESLKYNIKTGKVWVKKKYDDTECNSTKSIIENVVPIARVIFCLHYFKKMNLISFVEYYYEEELEDTSQIDMSNRNDYQEIKDTVIKNFIFNNIRSGIFDSEDLRDYKQSNYKTIEQRRHDKEIKKMQRQIYLAIAAAIIAAIGIIVPLIQKLIG